MEDFQKQVIEMLGKILEKQSEHDEKFKQIDEQFKQVDQRFDKVEDKLQLQAYSIEMLNQKLETVIHQTAKNTVEITQLKRA